MLKGLMTSKTVFGILIAAVIQLAPELGFSFSAEDGVLFESTFDSILTAISSLFAVYGRIVAKGPLKE